MCLLGGSACGVLFHYVPSPIAATRSYFLWCCLSPVLFQGNAFLPCFGLKGSSLVLLSVTCFQFRIFNSFLFLCWTFGDDIFGAFLQILTSKWWPLHYGLLFDELLVSRLWYQVAIPRPRYWGFYTETPVPSFRYWASGTEPLVLSLRYRGAGTKLPLINFRHWAFCTELQAISLTN